MLLEKDPEKRPSVRDILKMQLIRDKAMEFQNTTSLQRSKTSIYVKNIPIVRKAKPEQPKQEDEDANLTPV